MFLYPSGYDRIDIRTNSALVELTDKIRRRMPPLPDDIATPEAHERRVDAAMTTFAGPAVSGIGATAMTRVGVAWAGGWIPRAPGPRAGVRPSHPCAERLRGHLL